MATSLVNAESLLAIDVGTLNTRAFLFDVAEGAYRFLGIGQAPTTTGGPYNDIGEGVRMAIEQLQEITGRTLIGDDGRLIIPSHTDGAGIDAIVSTLSVGPAVQTAVVGLLNDVSLESAQHLAATTYSRVIETIGLNDRRKTEAKIDALIKVQPDVIIVAGGTESGANRSVLKLIELVGLACYLLPKGKRPHVIYSGNSALTDKVKARLEPHTSVHTTANLRPSFDNENLNQASCVLDEVVTAVRTNQMAGLQDLSSLTGGRVETTASAFGRMVRFLSQALKPGKGVLGVDLGASSTTIAAGFGGKLLLNVFAGIGMGEGIKGLLPHIKVEDMINWMPIHVQPDVVRDYLHNKAFYPASIPATVEDLAIEQAAARLIMRLTMRQSIQRYPEIAFSGAANQATQFEPIIASGSVVSHAPTIGQALMMLLDGIQPVGVTTLLLDQNSLLAPLGAAARVNSVLPVQILESGAFLHLGTVISPVSAVRYGTPILRVRVTHQDGEETRVEVKQGMLTLLPVPHGQKAQLQLEPLHRTDVGLSAPGRGGRLNVQGGALGVIIDARGRPLVLPADDAQRRDRMKKWLWNLGG